MNIDATEMPDIIYLCTLNVDIINEALDVPVVKQSASVSYMNVERSPNLHHRLCILPLYPSNVNEDQSHPLLANIPCMY
jgi:hypothetical protein